MAGTLRVPMGSCASSAGATQVVPFDFAPDRRRRLLRVNLRGYWDADTMDRYEDALRRELLAMKVAGGFKAYLIDTSQLTIQTQQIASRHEAKLTAAAKGPGVKVAMVMPSGRSKLQAARVATSAGPRTFCSETEATAWLLSPDP